LLAFDQASNSSSVISLPLRRAMSSSLLACPPDRLLQPLPHDMSLSP